MKNHADAMIFHTAVCVGAAKQPLSQRKNRFRKFFLACLRKKRSDRED